MLTPRKTDHPSHGLPLSVSWRWYDDSMAWVLGSDNVKIFLNWNRLHNERSRLPAGIRREVKKVSIHFRTTSHFFDARKSRARRCACAHAVRSRSFVALGGVVVSCASLLGITRKKSTDRKILFRLRNWNFNKIKQKAWTNLSVPSFQFPQAASASAISRASPGLPRLNQTSLISPGTMRVPAGDGLRATPSRRPKLRSSCLPRS